MSKYDDSNERDIHTAAFNMGGEDVPNFIKSTVYNSIIHDVPSRADALIKSLLEGPGFKLLHTHNRSKRNGYSDMFGWKSSSISFKPILDIQSAGRYVASKVGLQFKVDKAEIKEVDPYYHTLWYIELFYPDKVGEPFIYSYNEETERLTIWWDVDNPVEGFWPLPDRNLNELYVLGRFREIELETEIVTGTEIILGEEEEFPSTDGWEFQEEVIDGDVITNVWKRVISEEFEPEYEVNYTISEYMYLVEDTEEEIRKYRIDTVTEYLEDGLGPQRIRLFSESTVLADNFENLAQAFATSITDDLEYFPFIPLRLFNSNVDEIEGYPYKLISKTAKDAFGMDVDQFLKDLNLAEEEAENDEEIENFQRPDFVQLFTGVGIKSTQKEELEYLYQYFSQMQENEEIHSDEYFEDWFNNCIEYMDEETDELKEKPTRRHRLESNTFPDVDYTWRGEVYTRKNPKFIYDLEWSFIYSEVINTVGRDGYLKLWGGSITSLLQWDVLFDSPLDWHRLTPKISPTDRESDVQKVAPFIVLIEKKISPTALKRIYIMDLKGVHTIWGNNSSVTLAKDVFVPNSEVDICIPISVNAFRAMKVGDFTQLAMSAGFIVMHTSSYVYGWWARNWDKVLIAVGLVASIILIVFTGGASAALAAKLGAALGLSGVVATVVGATIMVLGSYLLSLLIQHGANVIFGEKIGKWVGLAASLILSFGFAALSAGGITEVFTEMSLVDTVLAGIQISFPILDTSVGHFIQEDLKLAGEKFKEEYEEIQKMMKELNEELLPKVIEMDMSGFEKPEDFFNRTLAVGSDVVETCLNMVYEFVELSMKTGTN